MSQNNSLVTVAISDISAKGFIRYSLSIGTLELIMEGRELKSGRISPYFFNSGLFCSGESLTIIAQVYAEKINAMIQSGELSCDVLFGPAYKGIYLVAAIAMQLSQLYGVDIEFASNRKEEKDHGEGGLIIGANLTNKRVLIIDDVITSGASKHEAVKIIQAQGGIPTACMVAFDRQEKGYDTELGIDKESSAAQEFEWIHNIPFITATTLDDLIDVLRHTPAESGNDNISEILDKILAYKKQYGV